MGGNSSKTKELESNYNTCSDSLSTCLKENEKLKTSNNNLTNENNTLKQSNESLKTDLESKISDLESKISEQRAANESLKDEQLNMSNTMQGVFGQLYKYIDKEFYIKTNDGKYVSSNNKELVVTDTLSKNCVFKVTYKAVLQDYENSAIYYDDKDKILKVAEDFVNGTDIFSYLEKAPNIPMWSYEEVGLNSTSNMICVIRMIMPHKYGTEYAWTLADDKKHITIKPDKTVYSKEKNNFPIQEVKESFTVLDNYPTLQIIILILSVVFVIFNVVMNIKLVRKLDSITMQNS